MGYRRPRGEVAWLISANDWTTSSGSSLCNRLLPAVHSRRGTRSSPRSFTPSSMTTSRPRLCGQEPGSRSGGSVSMDTNGRRGSALASGGAAAQSVPRASALRGVRSPRCIRTWSRSSIPSATARSMRRGSRSGRIESCGGDARAVTSGRRACLLARAEPGVQFVRAPACRPHGPSPLDFRPWPKSFTRTATEGSNRRSWPAARIGWFGGVAAVGTNGRPGCRTAQPATAARTAIGSAARLAAVGEGSPRGTFLGRISYEAAGSSTLQVSLRRQSRVSR